jgi:DNA-binding CsgD family transcriptional regulator
VNKILLAWIFFIPTLSAQDSVLIEGQLPVDESWHPVAYVCRIPSLQSLYLASDEIIVQHARLDSNGYFKIFIPATDQEYLYRLHVSKKSDPPSTLIIGGDHENHLFFIGKQDDTIRIDCFNGILAHCKPRGTLSNDELSELLGLVGAGVTRDSSMSRVSELSRESLKDNLLDLARDASSDLVKLMALEQTFGLSDDQLDEARQILATIAKTHPYFREPVADDLKLSPLWAISLFGILVIAILLSMPLLRHYHLDRLIRMRLSHQEMKVMQLSANGLTNKEIAQILHVEVSTIKSHINNIYSKMGIKSRREVLQYKKVLERRIPNGLA